jgi:hypothetical protein
VPATSERGSSASTCVVNPDEGNKRLPYRALHAPVADRPIYGSTVMFLTAVSVAPRLSVTVRTTVNVSGSL